MQAANRNSHESTNWKPEEIPKSTKLGLFLQKYRFSLKNQNNQNPKNPLGWAFWKSFCNPVELTFCCMVAEHVMKTLQSIESTDEKLSALCKKYAELLEELRTAQSTLKQTQRSLSVVSSSSTLVVVVVGLVVYTIRGFHPPKSRIEVRLKSFPTYFLILFPPHFFPTPLPYYLSFFLYYPFSPLFSFLHISSCSISFLGPDTFSTARGSVGTVCQVHG